MENNSGLPPQAPPSVPGRLAELHSLFPRLNAIKTGAEQRAPKGYDEKEGNVMATLDWSQCPAVESIPGKRSGAWVFKDTRMPVSTVFENLESGASIEEIMEWFDVTREQIVAVLEFAARSLDAPPPVQVPSQMVDAHSL
jgi:uncharacterized protein (DUF433 family)